MINSIRCIHGGIIIRVGRRIVRFAERARIQLAETVAPEDDARVSC